MSASPSWVNDTMNEMNWLAVAPEIVLLVAIIALGRLIVLVVVEHVPAASLIGIAALMLALTGGYYLIRRLAQTRREPATSLPDNEDLQ